MLEEVTVMTAQVALVGNVNRTDGILRNTHQSKPRQLVECLCTLTHFRRAPSVYYRWLKRTNCLSQRAGDFGNLRASVPGSLLFPFANSVRDWAHHWLSHRC